MDTKRETLITRQGNTDNEETLQKKRQQAAERQRLCRARQRQQQANYFNVTIHNHNPQPNARRHTRQSALRTSIAWSLRPNNIEA
jgi:hypothetical protein